MKVLVHSQPEYSTSIVLDEANKIGERIAAAEALKRVLEGTETRLPLEDEQRLTLDGIATAIHDSVQNTSGGREHGSHVFPNPDGLFEQSLRLFADLPDTEKRKLTDAEAYKRAEVAAMIAEMGHVFDERYVPEDTGANFGSKGMRGEPGELEQPKKVDWGNQYGWLRNPREHRAGLNVVHELVDFDPSADYPLDHMTVEELYFNGADKLTQNLADTK